MTLETFLSSHNPLLLEYTLTHLIQLTFFYLPSLIYISLPYFIPSTLSHRLQSPSKYPTPPEIKHCLKVVLRNQLLASTFHALLVFIHYKFDLPPDYRFGPLPSVAEVLRDITLCIILREILFYYTHRILHTPSLYKSIHKPHHKFTSPIALAAQYAHPLEHITANILPLSIPPVLLKVHVITWWIFLAGELVETTAVHSGFDFMGWARMHDLHHELFRGNYGTVGLMDWIHGTGITSTKEKEKVG
ncbi:sterol desaturase [Sistotremastrum niveocremeum HHB9708]|uniref:Sterol desaturase n=1 Tax=Sistotremastrum niveocremeum HHB9708 TaxID=1314777 RepID=A0A164ZYM3_9AGAM|nr:sterol desaturase [Sistotremastrum niveocremeum HHB9708]